MPLITLNGLWIGFLGSLIVGLLLWDGIAHLQSRRARLAAQALAQQALAEIDAYYANAPFGLCRLDTDLRCVRLNAALAAMNHRPVRAPLGKPLREILPYLADDLGAIARQALRTGQPFHDLEISGDTAFPSGQRQRWRVSGCPLKDANGQVNGLHLAIQEVTVPRYAETQMTQLLQLVENSAEFIGLARLDRRAWYLNQAGRQLVGLDGEAAVRATRIEDYLFPEDRAVARETVLSTVQQEGRWAGEFRLRHFQTGEPIPVWWQIFRLDDPKTGQPTSLATVIRDLRAIKAAERTLRQYQQIVAAFPDSVSLVDRQYRYQFVNAEYRRRTGRPETAIVGHSVAEMLGEAAFKGLIQPRLDRCLQGQTMHYQAWFEFTAGGRQFLDVIYSPYRNEQDEITGVVVTARDITPLKQAEEALHQSEQRLTLALSAAHAGAWEWNIKTNHAIWSEENYRLLGLTPGSVEAHYEQWLTCVHPDDRANVKQCVDEAVVQGRDLNIECRVLWPDGSLHWVHNVGKMGYDPMGEPAGIYGIQIDITERKQAEEAWRESKSRYHRLHESMRDAFVQVDMAGHIEEFNQTYQDMLGYSADELRQLAYQKLTPEKWHDVEANIVQQQILPRGYSDIYEKEYRRKDGSIFPVELRSILLRDSAGQPTSMWAIVRDITERKRAEQALRESERRFATLANSAPVLIWVTGPDGCEFINQAYATFFGVEEASVHEQDWIDSIHPEDRQSYLDLYQRALAQRAPFETQVRRRRADGCYRWMKSSGQPRFSVTGECLGYAGCLLDITELKQAEAALRQADRRKDEFLAMLAHELRNPLAPIGSAVQILNRLGPAEPKQQWARDVIERQVKHLARLVDDLLDSARLVRGRITLKKEPVELAAIVQQAVDAAQPLLEARQHQFHLTMPDSPVWLEGDPVRLVQILLNLLDNAAKYTEPGGRIELQADVLGDEVAVQVRDSGPGLSPALLSRVFELFEQGERTLDRAQGGLGIGLTLVRRLVELHGGRVEAHSAGPGQGAEFTVWLPLRATGIVPAETAIPSVAAQPAPTPRVLLVDDDPDVAESLAMLLQLEGFEVKTAITGQAALDLAHQFHPRVVLLDLGMPGMDGYEVARRLCAQPLDGSPPRLIALTGYGDEGTRQQVQEAGFTHHLVKPVELNVILTLLRSEA